MAVTYSALALRPVCLALIVGDTRMASVLARIDFPFVAEIPHNPLTVPPGAPYPQRLSKEKREKAKATQEQKTRLYLRDGFKDRYTGELLVYHPALLLLSLLLPMEFPYHPNWRLGTGHSMYWSLSPTYDHIVSLAVGGRDIEENWVSCSQTTNSRKDARSLEVLQWRLHEPGDITVWDGLLGWFLAYLDFHPGCLQRVDFTPEERGIVRSINEWLPAAKRVQREFMATA